MMVPIRMLQFINQCAKNFLNYSEVALAFVNLQAKYYMSYILCNLKRWHERGVEFNPLPLLGSESSNFVA